MKSGNNGVIWLLAAGVSAAALISACGGDSKSRMAIRRDTAPAEASSAQQGPAKKIDSKTAGTISGSVKWTGPKPPVEKIDVSGSPQCLLVSKETIYKEQLVVNPNDTVRDCIVSIDMADVYEPPKEPFTVDQIGCRYVPHVFVVMAGQKLNIKSSDQTQHNVHYLAMNDGSIEDNFAMSVPSTKSRTFTAADMIKFKCEMHPWMSAWGAVKTHPFFAVTGEDGTFTIANVPAGTYKLTMHHEKLGDQETQITVEANRTATYDFTLKQ